MSYEESLQGKQYLRDYQGRFTGPILNMHEGVKAEILNVDPDKALEEVGKAMQQKKPLTPKPIGLKPPKPPTMPRVATAATVPSTKTLTAPKVRVKQTGVSKGMWSRPEAELRGGLKSKDPLVSSMAQAALEQRKLIPKAVTVVTKADRKKDYSGALVGTGAVVGTTGLVGGGIPGTKPNSQSWGQRPTSRRKWPMSQHVRTATKGGIFGYRADAHEQYMKQEKSRLPNWKAHSRTNNFERGVVQGKLGAERQVVRHMKRGRVGANIALGAGAGMVGAGLYQRNKNKKVSKAQRDDYKADVALATGGSMAAAGYGGGLALDAQGRKWARRSAASLDRAKKLAPRTGGYDVKYRPESPIVRQMRGKNNSGPKTPTMFRGVPDVKAHRSTGDIQWNGKEALGGKSRKIANKVGRLRGAATQQRYFANTYGATAHGVKKLGKAGVVLGAAGLGAKTLQVKDEYRVKKAWDKKDTRDAALLGTGLAATPVYVGSKRVVTGVNNAHQRRYDRKIKRVKRKAPRDYRDTLPKETLSRTSERTWKPTPYETADQHYARTGTKEPRVPGKRVVYDNPKQRKTYRQVAARNNKKMYREIHALKAKRAKLPLSTSGSASNKIRLGAGAIALGGTWAGTRNIVDRYKVSKADKRDVDAAALGALAGGGAYQGATYALKPVDRRYERKIAESDTMRKVARDYKKKFLPSNAGPDHPGWRPYFRNYPKSLPGGKLKRVTAVTHTGKSGMALTAGAAAAGAGAAVHARRKHKANVSKMHPDASMLHVPGALNNVPPPQDRTKRRAAAQRAARTRAQRNQPE